MTHRNVETLIGRLATDPVLRRRFAVDSVAVLGELREEGYELTGVELEALAATDTEALRALAGLRSLLRPGGGVFVSFRLGHHPALTHAVLEPGLPIELQAFYARKGASWQLLPRQQALRQFDPDQHDILCFGVLPPE